jgi:uncharacterized membrane protein
MTHNTIWQYALYFFFLSGVGWILETIYRSFGNREFTNAGLLKGPYVPIYGTAALSILVVDQLYSNMPLVWKIVLLSTFATILEYATSFILEKFFSFKLWDYSQKRCNLKGRICLRYSLYWVVLVAFDLEVIQGYIYDFILSYSGLPLQIFTYIFSIAFLYDLFISFNLLRKVKNVHHILETKREEFSGKFELKYPLVWKDTRRLLQSFPKLYEKISSGTYYAMATTEGLGVMKNRSMLRESERAAFSLYADEILNHPVYLKLKEYRNHNSSIYDHSYQVAQSAYKIGSKLQPIIDIDMKSLVRGALLHDFFLYDWKKERPENGRLHAFEHPKEACKNANKYFGPLNDIEQDIILKHMWPLNIILPKHIETIIVTIVDKTVSSREFISETVREQKHKEE